MTSRRNVAACLVVLAVACLAIAEESKNLLKPTNKTDGWRLEQHGTAKATMAVDDDALRIEATEVDPEDWHVQVSGPGLDLKDGKEYVLTFKAKASADRGMPVNALIDQDDWHSVGLSETAELTKEWKEFKYEFKAEMTTPMKNRVTFIVGNEKGKVWIKDAKLTEK